MGFFAFILNTLGANHISVYRRDVFGSAVLRDFFVAEAKNSCHNLVMSDIFINTHTHTHHSVVYQLRYGRSGFRPPVLAMMN